MAGIEQRVQRPAIAAFGALSALATAAGAVIGYRALFSLYASYDDEGYFLVSVSQWLAHGNLYDGVYSEYGPGYVGVVGGLFRLLGLELDHDTVRMVTLVLWLAISALVGATLLRLTGSVSVGVAGQLTAYVVLFIIARDPLYPGGWVALLLVGIVAAAAFWIGTRPGLAMFAAGALAATTALMKVNLGGLALIALAVASVLAIPELSRRRWLGPATIGLAILAPFAIASAELDRAIVVQHALTVSLAMAAVMLAVPVASGGRPLQMRHLGLLVAGAGAAAVVIIGAAMVRGSGPADLVDGMIVQPFGHRYDFVFRLDPPTVGIVVTALGLLAAVVLRNRGGALSAPAQAALRIGAGVFTWVVVSLAAADALVPFTMAGAFAWVAAMPAPGATVGSRETFLRILVPALAVLNLMQPYPVAGNQVQYSVVLLVLAGGICIGDGAEILRRADSGIARGRAWLAVGAVAGACVWLVLGPGRDRAEPALDRYEDAVALGLPGAETLRVGAAERDAYRLVAARIEARCGSFFAEPGMPSFYIWTRSEPPTGMNVGNWMYQWDDEEQERALTDLERAPDLCIVRNQGLIDFWRQARPLPGGPLQEWIDTSFVPAGNVGGYEFLQPRS